MEGTPPYAGQESLSQSNPADLPRAPPKNSRRIIIDRQKVPGYIRYRPRPQTRPTSTTTRKNSQADRGGFFFLTTSLAARKCSHNTGFVLSTSQTHIAAPDKRYFNARSILTHSPLLQDDSSMISFPSLFPRPTSFFLPHYIPLPWPLTARPIQAVPGPSFTLRSCPGTLGNFQI